MIKINKTYTIKFVYAGINQYARFFEKDGKLVYPRLEINYYRGELPSLENKNIEEVLTVIKDIADNRAEIYLINEQPLNYYNNEKDKEYIQSFNKKFEYFIESEAINFFEKVLEPIMKENKWFISSSYIGKPILIEKNNDGEWDNIRDGFDFEYLCYKFVSNFKNVKINLNSEHSVDAFKSFFNCILSHYFIDKGYYLERETI